MLESHYRSQSKFSWDSLEAAENRLRAYRAMAVRRWQPVTEGGVTPEAIMDSRQAIQAALENDLDTPAVLATLSQLETAVDSGGISTVSQDAFAGFLGWLDGALGLHLSELTDITAEQRDLIAKRSEARESKDWTASDRLRDTLIEQGIALRDTATGAIWFRI